MDEIIIKVKENKQGTKTVTIPKKSNIQDGDLIKVTKVKVIEQ